MRPHRSSPRLRSLRPAFRPTALAIALASASQATLAASLTPLPLPGAFITGAALDISRDGRVIVGWAEASGGQRDAFRWDFLSTGYQATNLRPLIEGSLPTTPVNYSYAGSQANAVAVSGNSVFIGGSFTGPFGPELGFRIGPNGTDYFGTSQNYARGVNALSADGSVVAGTGAFPVFEQGQFVGSSGPRAFTNVAGFGIAGPNDFWPLDGFFNPPGPGGLSNVASFGTDLSADGLRLVGTTREVLPGGLGVEQRIFVSDLTGQTGNRLLDRVTDAVIGGTGSFLDNNSATAKAISADGTRIVGSFEQISNGLPLGVVYAQDASGDYPVERLLRPAAPVSGATFERSEAVDISDDNRLIVGNGTASSPGGVFSDDLFAATLWDNSPASGVQPQGALLLDVLSGAGVDVSRWLGEFRAEGLSGNGRYVVGQGEFDLGGGTLQWLPWVADLEGTGFWNAPPPPPPPGFADTFFFAPDPSGFNALGEADRWQNGLGDPAGLVPGAAQAAVFNSPDSYFIDLDGTIVGPGGVSGPDYTFDTLAVLDGQVTFFANSLPRPLIEATRQVTVDLSQSLASDPQVTFTRIDLRTPLLEVLSAGITSNNDVGVLFAGGSLDVTQLTIGSAGSSAWRGNVADVDRLDLAGYLLLTEEFVGSPGTPEVAAIARFGEVAVASGGWFNQSRSLLPGGSAPLANASTVTIDRTLDVAAGGRYELTDGRLEVGPGDPANGQPGLRVGGAFFQSGGEVEVAGDAEVTGLFSAQGWDLSFANPSAREAPVIDIGGTLTVAGSGEFGVSSNVPGGRVGLGALQVGGLGTSMDGAFFAFGVDVEVAGEVNVGVGASMATSNLSAASVNNAGTFSYAHVDLAGGDFISSGSLFSSGDPSALAPQTSINGRLENTGNVFMQNGLSNAVSGGVDNLGGVLYLGSQPDGSTRLITPSLYNSGLLWSFGGDNRLQGPAGQTGPGPGSFPTPTQVTNDGIIRVEGGRLGILGSLVNNGSIDLRNGAQVQANSVFQATAAGAQAEATAEGADIDTPSAEPMLLAAVAHATPVDAPTLEVSGDFTLGAGGEIDAVAGSVLRVGGSFNSSVVTAQDLSTLTLTFFGDDDHLLTAAGDITFGGLDVSGDGSVRIAREAGASGDLRIAFATTLTAPLFERLDAASGVGLLFAAIAPELLAGGPLQLAGGGSIALLDNGGNPVPLPAAFWLLSSGAAGLLVTRRRRTGRASVAARR